jgi:hypothetical protein
MSLIDPKNSDVLLVKVSAMALLTVALVWLPQTVGGVFQIIAHLLYIKSFDGDPSDFAKMMKPVQMQLLGASVGKIASFIVLVFLARWMFSYPPIIRKALSRTQASPENPPLP